MQGQRGWCRGKGDGCNCRSKGGSTNDSPCKNEANQENGQLYRLNLEVIRDPVEVSLQILDHTHPERYSSRPDVKKRRDEDILQHDRVD